MQTLGRDNLKRTFTVAKLYSAKRRKRKSECVWKQNERQSSESGRISLTSGASRGGRSGSLLLDSGSAASGRAGSVSVNAGDNGVGYSGDGGLATVMRDLTWLYDTIWVGLIR